MFLEEIGRPLQCWAAALGQTQGSLKIPPTVVLLLLCPGLSICRGRSFFSFGMSLAGREGALKQGVLISGGGIVLCIMYMGNIPCVEPIYPIVLPDFFFSLPCLCPGKGHVFHAFSLPMSLLHCRLRYFNIPVLVNLDLHVHFLVVSNSAGTFTVLPYVQFLRLHVHSDQFCGRSYFLPFLNAQRRWHQLFETLVFEFCNCWVFAGC